MKWASVCSGIACEAVAWMPLGWTSAFHAETAKFPAAVLAERWPETPNLGDLTKWREWPLERFGAVDLLVAGTPCQSFSHAGRRAGLDDPRGLLVFEFLGLARALRPRWLLWENVTGILSSGDGRDLATAFREMEGLGYDPAWRVLDAQYFGLAQRREHVFAVGRLGDGAAARAVLFERDCLSGNPPPGRETRTDVARRLTPSARTVGGTGNNDRTLLSGAGEPLNALPGGVARRVSGDGSRFGSGRDNQDIFMMAFESKNVPGTKPGDVSPRLRSGSHAASHANAGVPPGVLYAFDERWRGAEPKVHRQPRPPNAIADCTGKLDATKHWNVSSPEGLRRLTPRECERLMGLPDDYTRIRYSGPKKRRGRDYDEEMAYLLASGYGQAGALDRVHCPDGPRYSALGNGWPVPVIRWLGERIAMVDAITGKAE